MQIVILTIGTEGDVRPLVALGLGLKKLGHQVKIATDHSCQALVVDHGLEFAPLTGNFMEWMKQDKELQKRGLSPSAMAKAFQQRLLEMGQDWPEQGRNAAQGADLLIGNGMVYFLAQSLGEVFDIPVVESQLVPNMPSHHSPIMPLPAWMKNLPSSVNVALGHLTRQIVWYVYQPVYNDHIRPQLGLKAYPRFGPYYQKAFQRPKMFAFSPLLVEPRKKWPSRIQTTGPWMIETDSEWQPPAELLAFLEAGPKPVYIGFGSMLNHDAQAFTDMIQEAIEETGQRVILATGWGGLDATNMSEFCRDNIFSVGHIPHDWLLPRMAMAVHHGGAGTSHAVLRSGIPSVVVPVFGDQPFWAGRLERLGVAPPALPRETLTSADLTKAIAIAAGTQMQERAKSVAAKIRAENGVDNAIKSLQSFGLLSA